MKIADLLLDNPVLHREVRARFRPRALRGNNSLRYAIYALCAIILYFYVRGLGLLFQGQQSDARDLYGFLEYSLLLLITLLSPAISATAISQEREQQTWEILAVTRLTAQQVIFGKWMGRQLLVIIGFLIVLPFFLGAAVHGGIDLAAFAMVSIYLFICANFFTALGLMCSFRAKRTPTATAAALVITALLLLGTLIVNTMLQQFSLWPASYEAPHIESPVMWINPFYGLMMLERVVGRYTGSEPLESATFVVSVSVIFMVAVILIAAGWLIARFRMTDEGVSGRRGTRKASS